MRILILSCGTNASFHICKRLKEQFGDNVYLIGADINKPHLVSSAIYLDKYYTVSKSLEDSFVCDIENILCSEHPDYILPSLDCDQLLFYPGSEILKKYNVASLSTPESTLKYYNNKKTMNDELVRRGFHVPKLYNVDEVQDSLMYFTKPICGVGSVGANKRSGLEIHSLSSDMLVQEICHGPEVTVECFKYKNYFSYICRERIESKAGVCTKARVYKDPVLGSICKSFSESFEVPFLFNMQFMYDSDDEPVITDVNLRSAGGMSISYAAGWDVVSAIGFILLGWDNKIMGCFPENIGNQYIVRAYCDIVTKKERDVVAFDLDGTLIDSRTRHISVLNDVLSSFGVHIDTSKLIEYKSQGKTNVDFLLENGVSNELAKQIQYLWIEHIEDWQYLIEDTLYEDAKVMLQKYNDCDLILITARNNPSFVYDQLKKLGLFNYFIKVCVVGINNVVDEKSKILSSYRVKQFVGDTKSDYDAAKKAGVVFHYHEGGFHEKNYIFKN